MTKYGFNYLSIKPIVVHLSHGAHKARLARNVNPQTLLYPYFAPTLIQLWYYFDGREGVEVEDQSRMSGVGIGKLEVKRTEDGRRKE